jgi:peptide/nickel transport system substrate-binding protein
MKVFSNGTMRATALLAISLGLFACSKKGGDASADGTRASADVGSPTQGDWLIIHGLSDPENLNPLTSTDAGATEIDGQIYEGLTTTDWETLNTIPILADSLPKMSEDRLSYEVSIRKDAKFSDGKPVTADDFIFYLKALKNPYVVNAAPTRGYYVRVDRAEKIDGDPQRLRVVMTEPYYLGDQWVGGLLAMPKHIWDPQGLTDKMTFEELNKMDPKKNPVIKQFADSFQVVDKARSKAFLIGSGPYKFEDWKRNDRVVLVRNENYWKKSDPKYGQQYPSQIIWRTVNDMNAALAALKSGDIDFMPNIEKVLYNNVQQRKASVPEFQTEASRVRLSGLYLYRLQRRQADFQG